MADVAPPAVQDPVPAPAAETPAAPVETAPAPPTTQSEKAAPVVNAEAAKAPQQPVPPEVFANAKDSLKKTPVYDHLSRLIQKILHIKPSNPYRDFESISNLVKREKELEAGPQQQPGVVAEDLITSSKNLINLVKDPHVLVAEVPDFFSLSDLFNQGGINISQEETYRIFQSLKKVEQTSECKSVRFYGKMFGTGADYYIIESERNTIEEQVTIGNVEMEQGVGVNKYIYFVSNNGLDGWRKLPDAQPLFIQKSRKMRKLLSGNLDKKMVSQPVFEGTEADYLRAIIARVAASTVISPNGYYKFDDDGDGAVVLNTDFEWPSVEALLHLDSWVHHIPYILPQGRTSYTKAKKLEAKDQPAEGEPPKEEEEKKEDEEGDEDPNVETGPPLLAPVSEDKIGTTDSQVWTIKSSYMNVQLKYNAVVMRNNLWHGAITVGYRDRFANLYIGWGLQDINEEFIAESLPKVQTEFTGPAEAEGEEQDKPAEVKPEEEAAPPAEDAPPGDGDEDAVPQEP